MKRALLTVGIAAALVVAWSVGQMQGQAQAGKVVFASPDQAKFTEMGNGSSMAAIWGDANMGAHATYTKFEPGFYSVAFQALKPKPLHEEVRACMQPPIEVSRRAAEKCPYLTSSLIG